MYNKTIIIYEQTKCLNFIGNLFFYQMSYTDFCWFYDRLIGESLANTTFFKSKEPFRLTGKLVMGNWLKMATDDRLKSDMPSNAIIDNMIG